MEKIMYPMKNIWITQTYGKGTYSHQYNKALDNQGKDNISIDNIIAPYTGKVVRTYPTENEVWFQSIDKVEFADGTVDYATMFFAHDSDISNLSIGMIVPQGNVFLQEGRKYLNKYNADLHTHFEIQAGLTAEWIKAKDGGWNLPKSKKPEDCFFIDDTYNVINTAGLNFKKITPIVGTPTNKNKLLNQIEVLIDNLQVRSTPNGLSIGYIKKGIYNYDKYELNGKYTWYQVEPNRWIAYDKSWATLYKGEDYQALLIENTMLKQQVMQLQGQVDTQQAEINRLNIELKSFIKIDNVYEKQ